jgi:hypothetical protein
MVNRTIIVVVVFQERMDLCENEVYIGNHVYFHEMVEDIPETIGDVQPV